MLAYTRMFKTWFLKVEKLFNTFWWFLKSLGTKRKWVAVVAVSVIVAGVGYAAFSPRAGVDDGPGKSFRTVSLVTIGEYSTNLPPLSLVGQVKSQSEASITAEAQGVVSRVYHSLGDWVSAGTIIGELENASERASVQHAEAARDAAAATLEKTKLGTRDEQLSVLIITRDNAEESLRTAELTAENTIRSAHATVADAVRRSVDDAFSNPETNQPSLIPNTSNSQLESDAENLRVSIQSILERHENMQVKGSINDLDYELELVAKELVEVREFISTTISALNNAIPSTEVTSSEIDAWRLASNSALTSINNARTSILSITDTLDSRRASLAIAEKNLEQGQTGGQLEDIQAAEANLRQAEANLQSARVALQKTLLRSPISGVIESINLEQGQFVSTLTPVARVANIGALEIIAYASEKDLPYLEVGSEALIDGKKAGVVTKVAPSLDPQTKRIEVRVGVEENIPLTNGQSTQVVIARTGTIETNEIRVPLSALKVTTDTTYVFSVNENSETVPHEVMIENILGGDAVISGVDPTLRIIKDARGLQPEVEVVVK